MAGLQERRHAAAVLQLLYQTTPWAISKSYISYRNSLNTNRTQNLVALEMFGPGDPTGRGLAYSFVRQRARVSRNTLHLRRCSASIGPCAISKGLKTEA